MNAVETRAQWVAFRIERPRSHAVVALASKEEVRHNVFRALDFAVALFIPFRRIATPFEFRHRQFAVEPRRELTAVSGTQFASLRSQFAGFGTPCMGSIYTATGSSEFNDMQMCVFR